ncbi:MAG: ATP-binding protein [Candidatus Hodarchaeales archaeon]
MKEEERCFSNETIKAFEGLNSYLRHKALGNVSTSTLALDLFKHESDVTFLDMASSTLGKLSIMLTRSHEIQSIFELSEIKFTIKEIIELIWQDYRKSALSIEYQGNVKVLISNYIGSVLSGFLRNAFIYRKANKIVVHNEFKERKLIISLMDNGNNFPKNLMKDIVNNATFSSLIHRESEVDLFIAKEILKAHNIRLDLQSNASKGGIFILKLPQQDFVVR